MCLKVISGYEHFKESPICGDILGANIPDQVHVGDAEAEEEKYLMKLALKHTIQCPKCKEIN